MASIRRWPTGTGLRFRAGRPWPGWPGNAGSNTAAAHVSGLGFPAFLPDTRGGQLAGLEVRHRSHARAEDRIRAQKATGLRNLPCRGYEQNKAWLELSLAAADLLTWAQALCFSGGLARCEPAAFRYRITRVAARLIRTGRRWQLRLDKDWPWATHLAAALSRLRAAPWPA